MGATESLHETCVLESDAVPVAKLSRLALLEGQRTKPLYRAHRWFARRLGSQFRGLLIGALLPDNEADRFWRSYYEDPPDASALTVLDPFLGGGTSLVEASRLGATVVGMDIDPVPATISRFQLEAPECPSLETSLTHLKDQLGSSLAPFHETIAPDGEPREVLYHFWVQVTHCKTCETEMEIHPHFQLAYDREAGAQWAFCRHCHQVEELPINREILVCGDCDRRTHIHAGTLRDGVVLCLNCRAEEPLAANSARRDGPPAWRLFAQQYLVRHGPGIRQLDRRYKRATDRDRELYEEAAQRFSKIKTAGEALVPTRQIPAEGRMDGRPLIHGFSRYDEMFNARQLLHLHLLASEIRDRPPGQERKALGLAFSEHLTTNCMFCGYAFGYGRTSPLFSFHGYTHIVRPVEVNPWLERIGRGTFPNAVLKLQRAIDDARQPTDVSLDEGRRRADTPVGTGKPVSTDLSEAPESSVVAARPAEDLAQLPADSVDIVLTDPPYGDNVAYSELSDFYLAWHQVLGLAPRPYDDPTTSAPLQANISTNGRGPELLSAYAEGLATIFRQANRVLKPGGLAVFTFHHVHAPTWMALAQGLAASGLTCTNVFPLRGEGRGGLHSHSGTIKWDAVFVLRLGQWPPEDAGPSLRVTGDGIRRAREACRTWSQRLSDEDLGFRDPDRVNLTRAMLVKEALPRPGTGQALETALKQVPDSLNGGE